MEVAPCLLRWHRLLNPLRSKVDVWIQFSQLLSDICHQSNSYGGWYLWMIGKIWDLGYGHTLASHAFWSKTRVSVPHCLLRFSKNKPQAQIKILSLGFALIAPLFPWLCDIHPLLFGQSGMLISYPVGEEDRRWKDGVVTQGLLYQKRWNPVVMSFSHEQSWSSPSLHFVIFLSWIMIIVVDILHFLITRLSHV